MQGGGLPGSGKSGIHGIDFKFVLGFRPGPGRVGSDLASVPGFRGAGREASASGELQSAGA